MEAKPLKLYYRWDSVDDLSVVIAPDIIQAGKVGGCHYDGITTRFRESVHPKDVALAQQVGVSVWVKRSGIWSRVSRLEKYQKIRKDKEGHRKRCSK